MKIVIVGDGKVGHSLAERLASENHDVTVIDKNADVMKKDAQSLDVLFIKGNGVSTKTLREAGVEDADLLIATTSSDEINMVCCLTAKKIGNPHTVARIRDPEYANELSILKDELGLDLIINPEQSAAYEIARIFNFPGAAYVEGFYKGKINLVGIKMEQGGFSNKITVGEVTEKYNNSFTVCLVERDKRLFVPGSDLEIEGSDVLYLVGASREINKLCEYAGHNAHKIKNIMIMGGSRIAFYLANIIKDMGCRIKIIEEKPERCLELNEQLPDVLIINGDGTDETLLESESLGDMDAFVALTGWDEDNLMTAIFAKRCGVPKVIAKTTRVGYFSFMKDLGVDAFIDLRQLTTWQIMRYVNGLKRDCSEDLEIVYSILGDRAKAGIYKIDKKERLINTSLRKIKPRDGVLIGAIIRNNDIVIPAANEILQAGDKVVIITVDSDFGELSSMLGGDGR